MSADIVGRFFQSERLLSRLDKVDKNSIIILDGGFTSIVLPDGSEKSPFFGKQSEDAGKECSGPSLTEKNTFLDVYAIYSYLRSLDFSRVIPVLTLSDWISNSSRNILIECIRKDKMGFFPPEYMTPAIKSDREFFSDLRIILLHQFSSILQHEIRNLYSGIKRKKMPVSKLNRHKTIYEQKGWLYLTATGDEGDRVTYLSTRSFRCGLEHNANSLILETRDEGGVGINIRLGNCEPRQLCGATSASRMLYMNRLAKEIYPEIDAQVVTIHVFDKRDDSTIDRKLAGGIMALDPFFISGHTPIAVIKDADEYLNLIELNCSLKDKESREESTDFELDSSSAIERIGSNGDWQDVRLAYT